MADLFVSTVCFAGLGWAKGRVRRPERSVMSWFTKSARVIGVRSFNRGMEDLLQSGHAFHHGVEFSPRHKLAHQADPHHTHVNARPMTFRGARKFLADIVRYRRSGPHPEEHYIPADTDPGTADHLSGVHATARLGRRNHAILPKFSFLEKRRTTLLAPESISIYLVLAHLSIPRFKLAFGRNFTLVRCT